MGVEYVGLGRTMKRQGTAVNEAAPPRQTLSISEVRQRFASLVAEAARGGSRVLVARSGVPVAAIVSPDDLARLERLEEQDRHAWDVLERMRAPFRDVPADEIEREADRAVAAVRARRRAEPERAKETAATA